MTTHLDDHSDEALRASTPATALRRVDAGGAPGRLGQDEAGAAPRASLAAGGPAQPPIAEALRSSAVADHAAAAAATRAALERAEREGLVDVAWTTVDTPIGRLHLAATMAGLVRVGFDLADHDLDDMLEHLARRISPRVVESPARLDHARRQLDEYFEGRRQHFDVPLDWRLSSGFRRTVLERLFAEVGYGRTVSYLELAAASGNPRASRAVGSAMATNPIPVVVPCHRVLRTGGHLGGYGGGLPTKVKLLELEGALPAGQQRLL